jgi:hypothetical protein
LCERDPAPKERRRGNAFLVADLVLQGKAFLKQWVNLRQIGLRNK